MIVTIGLSASEVRAYTKSGNTDVDATIPLAPSTGWSVITISGAPSTAIVDNISVNFNIDHDRVADVNYYFGSEGWSTPSWYGAWKTGDDWLDGYNETYNGSHTFAVTGNQTVNQSWFIVAKDISNNSWNDGRIDSWSITITYHIPPPRYDATTAQSHDLQHLSNGSKYLVNNNDCHLSFRPLRSPILLC